MAKGPEADEAYMLGAIYKIMKHYIDNPAKVVTSDMGKLIEWVRPRCEPYKKVRDFNNPRYSCCEVRVLRSGRAAGGMAWRLLHCGTT